MNNAFVHDFLVSNKRWDAIYFISQCLRGNRINELALAGVERLQELEM
jgi:hypothetical protein